MKTSEIDERVYKLLFVIGYLFFIIKNILLNTFPSISIPNGFFGAAQILIFIFLTLWKNKSKIVVDGIIFLVVAFILVLLSQVASVNSKYLVSIMSSDSVLCGYFIMLYYMSEHDADMLLDSMRKISYIMIVYYLIGYFTGTLNDENGKFSYMGFGYGIMPYVAIIMQKAFVKKKGIDILLLISSTILVVVSANRGAILQWGVCLFVFYVIYGKHKRSKYVIVFIILLLTIIIAVLPLQGFEILIQMLLNSQLHNTLINRIRNGEFFVSGREDIYKECWSYILQKPLLGYGIGYDRVIFNGSYPHNILLELYLDFGIIIGTLLFMALFRRGIQACSSKNRTSWDDLYIAYFLPIIIMLFNSNSYLNTKLFWELVGLTCMYAYEKRNLKKGDFHKYVNQ